MIGSNNTFHRIAPTAGGKVWNMSRLRVKLFFWGCHNAVHPIYEASALHQQKGKNYCG
jgi:hypothetical protein